jgi:hypothetical protein
MNVDQPGDLAYLQQFFTTEELAMLTPEELRLLAALKDEELPDLPAADRQAAAAEYRRLVHQQLRDRGNNVSASALAPAIDEEADRKR